MLSKIAIFVTSKLTTVIIQVGSELLN